MKIKFSKVMATVCALSVAFAGLTAFATENQKAGNVTVTTTYDAYDNNSEATMSVTATIYGDAGSEVTYYVEKADDGGILYINQYTIPGSSGVGNVEAKFTTTHAGALNAVAKFGTDGSGTFPKFKFAEGTNFLTQGDAHVAVVGVSDITDISVEGVDLESNTKCYKAKVSGAASEYGIRVGEDYYPAVGCSEVDGTYIVILKDINVSGDVEAYAKDFDGTVKSTQEFTN